MLQSITPKAGSAPSQLAAFGAASRSLLALIWLSGRGCLPSSRRPRRPSRSKASDYKMAGDATKMRIV